MLDDVTQLEAVGSFRCRGRMYTHKAIRRGRSISITIFGQYGAKFARRLAEDALRRGERLSGDAEVTTDNDGQRFTYLIEEASPAVSPAVQRVGTNRHPARFDFLLRFVRDKPFDPGGAA